MPKITIKGVGAFITVEGQDRPRPVMHGATVSVSKEVADQLVADGVAVLGDTLPDDGTGSPVPVALDDLSVDELEQRARDAGVYDSIKGTGKDGNVVKADLLNALRA